MAVGDNATAGGFPLVPDSGAEGRVRYGAREINRTRDFIAQVKNLIPKSKSEYRDSAGIRSGSDEPSGGDDGDLYVQIPGGLWGKVNGIWRKV